MASARAMRASGDSGARRYEILVRGELGDHFGSAFEDVTLSRVEGNTALTGIVDQQQLRDLLDQIQELGLDLVSVRPRDE